MSDDEDSEAEAFLRLSQVCDLDGVRIGQAAVMEVAADRIEQLSSLLLTALALHGAYAHTHSEKEWRENARRSLKIRQ